MNKLIIVEGADDRDFLQELIKQQNNLSSKKDIEEKLKIRILPLIGNYTKLSKSEIKIKQEIIDNEAEKVCLILDSDVNPKDKVEEAWNELGLEFDKNNLSIFLIENCLEDLILKSINQESSVQKYMQNYFSNLNKEVYKDCSLEWKHLAKKQLAVYLSGVKLLKFTATPNCVQHDYCNEYINLEHKAFSNLKQFLQEFVK